jgi:hypothetical protein
MPRVLGGSYGFGRFLMGKVPLYGRTYEPTFHLRDKELHPPYDHRNAIARPTAGS